MKLNSEFNYRYQIIGETPWAKLQHLQEFYAGRVRAAALEEVSRLKYEAKKLELAHLEESGALPHVIMNLRAEILETESFFPSQSLAFAQNQDEIAILEKLLAEFTAIAEQTRIPGYTDEQMFEANAALEFTVNIGRDLQSEWIAYGRPSPAKIRNAMSNPFTMNKLQEVGLLPTTIMVNGKESPLVTFGENISLLTFSESQTN